MPEELMKGFLEQTIECVDAFSDALNYILHPDLVYSGCFANISLIFYPFNYGANKGIGVWLGNIQLVKSGGRIVSRITAQEDFQPVSYTELLEVN